MKLKLVFLIFAVFGILLTISGCDDSLNSFDTSTNAISTTDFNTNTGSETDENTTADTLETAAEDTSVTVTEPEETTNEAETTEAVTTKPETPKCEHNYIVKSSAEPTCTKKGQTVYSCTLCKKTYTEYKKATGHTYGDWVITKEPTCEEKGHKKKTCQGCEKTVSSQMDIIECIYEDATCAKPRICMMCKESDEGLPLFHKWDEGKWLTENTATGEGEKIYTCSVCNGTRKVIIDKNLPSELADNFVLRSIEYLGHDVKGQIEAGDLYSVYGAFELSEKYRSGIFYDEKGSSGIEGLNMISSKKSPTGKLPDLATIKKRGLICASFTTYYLFNYLPNVEGINTNKLFKAFSSYKDVGYNYRAVVTWNLALDKLVKSGDVEKIGTSVENVDREKLSVGDIVVFKSEKYRNSHVAIYAGHYRGEDYIVHSTWKRGVEINTLSAIADPYGDENLPGSVPSGFFHINYDALPRY